VFQHVVAAGDQCKCGDVVAYIFDSDEERQTFLNGWQREAAAHTTAVTITKSAQTLIDQHHITDAQVYALGKKLVKRSDIEALLNQQTEKHGNTIELPRRQLAIGDVVSRSHTTIPKAFLLMKVYCDDALTLLNSLSVQEDCMIGLTELLVKIVAALRPRFPFCFGTLADAQRFVVADESHIGVTLDVGKGLFIPVIRNVEAQSLSQIARQLMDFRIKAFRDSFNGEDLTGGSITISLNTDADTIFVLPVILPEQSCMLSLSAVQAELVLTSDQTLATRSFINVGLAYDHRVINGYDAVQFVKAIKAHVEAPEHGIAT